MFVALKQTRTFEKLLQRLEEMCTSDNVIITPKTIQFASTILSKIVFVVPKLCERLLIFVNENRHNVDGNTVAQLLFYLFSMGYEPYRDLERTKLYSGKQNESKNQFLCAEMFDFEHFIRIIHRDFDLIPTG